MSKPTHTSSALVVLSDQALTYSEEQLPKLQLAALHQLEMVRQLQRESAARAIMAGLTLHRVKASLKHGHFMPWLRSNLSGSGYSQCNYYMRLASAFVVKGKVTKPDLLALPGDQSELALDGGEGAARAFYAKLAAFVGDKTLNDLLDKYGIKDTKAKGGARTPGASNTEPVIVDPETLRLQSMDEIGSALERARNLLIKENRLSHFASHTHQVQAIVKGFRDLADEIETAAKPLLSKAS